MIVEMSLIVGGSTEKGSESLIKHQERMGSLPDVQPAVDIHGTTCIHQEHVMAPMCGKPVINQIDVPHSWLCVDHLNQVHA